MVGHGDLLSLFDSVDEPLVNRWVCFCYPLISQLIMVSRFPGIPWMIMASRLLVFGWAALRQEDGARRALVFLHVLPRTL